MSESGVPTIPETLAEPVRLTEAQLKENLRRIELTLEAAAIAIPAVLLSAHYGNLRCQDAAERLAPILAKLKKP